MEPTVAIDAISREIRDTTRDGKAARMIVAERSYPTTADDVWDALTSPERLPRWFLPISGDLELGGRYQLEGNAGGTIETCDPPKHLGVTWEFGGSIGWVDVYLTETGDDTMLRLEHVGLVDDFDDKWDEYGPGAVGVGWDLTLFGLGEHLATGADLDPNAVSPELLEAMRRSSDAWGQASIAYGTPREQAEAAAVRTAAFYTGG
jgi:uncharacterized protein YndB with AHSA1/START domain